jgi:hypothetical protein
MTGCGCGFRSRSTAWHLRAPFRHVTLRQRSSTGRASGTRGTYDGGERSMVIPWVLTLRHTKKPHTAKHAGYVFHRVRLVVGRQWRFCPRLSNSHEVLSPLVSPSSNLQCDRDCKDCKYYSASDRISGNASVRRKARPPVRKSVGVLANVPLTTLSRRKPKPCNHLGSGVLVRQFLIIIPDSRASGRFAVPPTMRGEAEIDFACGYVTPPVSPPP